MRAMQSHMMPHSTQANGTVHSSNEQGAANTRQQAGPTPTKPAMSTTAFAPWSTVNSARIPAAMWSATRHCTTHWPGLVSLASAVAMEPGRALRASRWEPCTRQRTIAAQGPGMLRCLWWLVSVPVGSAGCLASAAQCPGHRAKHHCCFGRRSYLASS